MKLDLIIGLQRGDESKGKITYSLLKQRKDLYTHCMRFGGSHNSGHTIYHEGKKIITHIVPTGVFLGIRSVIGPGCVVSPALLEEELVEIEKISPNARNILKIANNTHIITEEHLREDSNEQAIGTTRKGNGPAYRDKYNRTGMRAEDFYRMKEGPFEYGSSWYRPNPILIDIYEEFYKNPGKESYIMMEGAQGFYLDIDHGDYPFVTSSHTTVAGALANGFPHTVINEIWGAAKVYETYVGTKEFQPPGEIFKKIAIEGQEYGATTGRLRQVDFLHLDALIKAININGVQYLVLSKVDILKKLNTWNIMRAYPHNKDLDKIEFNSQEEFENHIIFTLSDECPTLKTISFSSSPYEIGDDEVDI